MTATSEYREHWKAVGRYGLCLALLAVLVGLAAMAISGLEAVGALFRGW